MPAERVAHFKILDKLGQGGMGVVYRAEDERLGRQVALKVLRPEVVGSPEARARFMREARAAAAVTHPAIATIFEVNEDGGEISIVMELIPGPTLRRVLEAGPIAPDRALRIATAIAAGLARAHRAGLVHRDLKPENVILTDGDEPKILDFGLARMAAADAHGDTDVMVTGAGAIVGTPGYMSPEQANGDPVDARSDVFSFGAVLFEMLTGRRPFEGATAFAIVAAMLQADAPRPSTVQPGVPSALDRIVGRCISRQASDRYSSAAELHADLVAAAAVAAAPPPVRRSILPFVLGAIAIVASVGLVLAWSHGHRPPLQHEPRFELLRRGRNVSSASLSADGQRLAYLDEGKLHLRDLRSGAEEVHDIGYPMSVTLFPDGDRVLVAHFVQGTSQQLEIYRSSTRTSEPVAIAPFDGAGPALSADGHKIAYVDRDGVRVFDLANGTDQALASFSNPVSLSWSPSGRHLLVTGWSRAALMATNGTARAIDGLNLVMFASWADDGDVVFDQMLGLQNQRLEAAHLDEETGVLGTARVLRSDRSEFSPTTGHGRIAAIATEYTSVANELPLDPPGPPKILLVDVGGDPLLGTEGRLIVTQLKTGVSDVYVRMGNGEVRPLLVEPNVRKKIEAALPTGVIVEVERDDGMHHEFVAWSGEPRELFTDPLSAQTSVACSTGGCVRLRVDERQLLHVSQLDVAHPEAAAEEPERMTVHVDATPFVYSLSPDGNTLAIPEHDLVLLDLRDGSARSLDIGAVALGWSSWMPDGTHLVVSKIDGAWGSQLRTKLVRVALDGTSEVLFEDPVRPVGPPSVAPDGRSIAFATTDINAQLWLIDP